MAGLPKQKLPQIDESSDSEPSNFSQLNMSTDDPRIGTVIGGKYRIIDCVGQGGMGTVYRAEHVEIGRKVAIKILRSHLLDNEEYLARFQREARVAHKLTHPNTVTAFDFGLDGQTPYLVMPFIEGKSLKQVVLERGPLHIDTVLSIVSQISSALDEAHDLGIVHRDLKPDNIMIASRPGKPDWAWVLDFGVAKPLLKNTGGDEQGGAPAALTIAGAFVGTPQYMSPEQALGKEVDRRTDIYALGIILYEMLTGDLPFKSISPVEVLMEQINSRPIPIRTFRPELKIPEHVSRAVQRALEKQPEDRQNSAGDLFTELTGNSSNLGTIKPRSKKGQSFVGLLTRKVFIAPAALLACGILAYSYKQFFLSTPNHRTDTEQSSNSNYSSPSASLTASGLDDASESEQMGPQVKPKIDNVATDNDLGGTQLTSNNSPLSDQNNTQPKVIEPEVVEKLDTQENLPKEQEPTIPETPTTLEAPTIRETTVEVSTALESQTAENSQDNSQETNNREEHLRLEKELEQEANQLSTESESNSLNTQTEIMPDTTPELSKKDFRTLYQEANELVKSRSFAQAVPLLLASIEKKGDNLAPRLSLIQCYLRLDQLQLAKEQLDIALKLDRNYAPTHYNLAAFYARTGDTQSSLDSLKTAIRLYPPVKRWAKEDQDFSSIASNEQFLSLVR